jgi:two-component system LytT family response regulator
VAHDVVKMRAIIVDDEPLAREYLQRLLADEPDVEVVRECASGLEAVASIRADHPDLVFLDVQMPELNGFEALEHLGPPLPAVVFVTAYDEYAIQAFDVHALDYLLKPFDRPRFQRTMRRVRELRGRAGSGDERVTALLDALEKRRKFRPFLVVKAEGRSIVLRTREIDFIESAANYVKVHAGKESYFLRETLSAVVDQLDPEMFARIHRSTIVNLERIRELQPYFHGDYVVKLADGRSLTLSRTYRERLAERLGRDL